MIDIILALILQLYSCQGSTLLKEVASKGL